MKNDYEKKLKNSNESLNAKMNELNNNIKILKDEIEFLVKQIPNYPDNETIEKWLIEELAVLERKCLSEIINVEVDENIINQLLRHEPISKIVRGLLIKGWGYLQPVALKGPFGTEKTGLQRVQQEIGNKVATWQIGLDGKPIFRVFYLQYIYLLEKNINVYGFFYDFITRNRYGKKSETFQYNHVTNFSIREVQLDEDNWIQRSALSISLANNFISKEINSFSLAVSSGAHFKCVLIDEAVVDGLNEWLNYEEKINEIKNDNNQKNNPNEEDSNKWANPYLEDDEFLREMVKKRAILEDENMNSARKALQQVREKVEKYA